ncbi:unnamed protein product [Echinostoma caproni]|uniref:Borealin N-terminal domain-containing protein n=1 Tax=Echinostoma caproni TaxID=27848 RepID=A0A183AYM2_9TREM|nr:unnamed protein product [Echinostoma caproni]
MSLPLLKAMDLSSLEPKEGWTLKGFLAVFEEQRQRIQFHLQKRAKSIDLAIERFAALKTQVAALPNAIKELPYFEFINRDHHNPVLDASEVKKRSRMEWEESVRTRTGKRPRRGVQSSTEKRPHASTVKRGTAPESVMLNLQSIMENDHDLRTGDQTAFASGEPSVQTVSIFVTEPCPAKRRSSTERNHESYTEMKILRFGCVGNGHMR